MQQVYLKNIRENSHYPRLRQFIDVYVVIGYIVIAGINVWALSIAPGALLFSIFASLVILFLVLASKEAMQMSVDFVDSTLDRNSESINVLHVEQKEQA